MNNCKVLLPNDKDKVLKFKNHICKEKVPFAVYANLESILVLLPVANAQKDTAAYQKHITSSIAFYTHCNFDDSLSELEIYRRKDCIEWFI